MSVSSHSFKRGTFAIVACAVVVAPATPAIAGAPGGDASSGGSGGNQGGESGGGTIAAQVQLDTSHNGGKGGTPVEPATGDWPPPLCWMQPKFTGKQYKKDEAKTWPKDPRTGKKLPGFERDFHEGDKGAWWVLTYDVDRITNPDVKRSERTSCATDYQPTTRWIPAQKPKPQGAISPLVLSGQSYKAMKLPAPPVKLSPPSDRQKVNLPVRAKFDAPLHRHWVTAKFNAHGVDLAATTVATPKSLRIDAGTSDADPQSCTYDLAKKGKGYQVDTAGSGCKITYRKASGDRTYPLKAQVEWDVKWTDSDDPDGPAQKPKLPDGRSTYEQPVTVKEIQTIVRNRQTASR